jgi:hypothetical protein
MVATIIKERGYRKILRFRSKKRNILLQVGAIAKDFTSLHPLRKKLFLLFMSLPQDSNLPPL